MVGSDGAAAEHLLAFREKRRAFCRVLHRAAQRAGDLGPAELGSSVLADRERLAQQHGAFGAATGIEQHARLHLEALRFEAPSAELAGEPHHPLEIALHRVVIGELIAGEDAHRLSEQLGAWLPDQRGGPSRRVTVLARLTSLVEIDAAEPHHRAIRHLDAAEAVLLAERDTPAEIVEGGPHPALGVGRIRQPAERAGLRLRRAGAPRIAEAALVLLAATVDVSQRKEDVASEMMETRELAHHVVALGRVLRIPEELERLAQAFAYTETFGKSEP